LVEQQNGPGLVIGGIAAKLAFRPQISPSRGGTGAPIQNQRAWMTLNGRYALYYRKDKSFGTHHKNLNEDRPTLSAAEM